MQVLPWFLNFEFNRRARRSHVWANFFAWIGVFIGLVVILSLSGAAKEDASANPVVVLIIIVAIIARMIDGLAMTFRRAHDTSRSGWIWILCWIPLINLLPLYWLYIQDSDQGPNKYGPAVKEFYVPPAD